MTYVEAHGNPRYIREIKVRLPTAREYGLVNPKKILAFIIKPYDVNSGLIQALPPTPEAPGLSIQCGLCGKEMTNLLIINEGLSCFMCAKIKMPLFCLQALARAAYDWWELDYSYEEYLRQKARYDRRMDAANKALEALAKAFGHVKPVEYGISMVADDENRIKYLVHKK